MGFIQQSCYTQHFQQLSHGVLRVFCVWVMPSANECSFLFSFLIRVFPLFSFLGAAVASASVLTGSGEAGHPCLVLRLRGRTSVLHIKCDGHCGLFIGAPSDSVPFYRSLPKVSFFSLILLIQEIALLIFKY